MKKNLLVVLSIALWSIASAQNAIPNPGFENWTSHGAYSDPTSWGTINSLTYFLGVVTATKATAAADIHSGSAALKLQSLTVPIQGTAPGIAATGTINQNTSAIDGGVVYTKRPIAITGWYKYQPNGIDTGSIYVTFWRWNNSTHVRDEVGTAEFSVTATVTTYTQFTQNINYTLSGFPDSMAITLLTSSRAQGSPSGTVMFIDDLDFVLCNNYSATATATGTATCTASNGTAFVTTANGAGGDNYQWSNNSVTGAITAAAGTYTVTATDGNGCSATASTTISATSTAITSTITSTATTCGASTGSVTVTPTNGSPNYTYAWNGGGNTASLSNLGAGNYQVTITDANGCSGTAGTSVSTPNGPSATQVTTDVTCFGANNGAVNVTTTGGSGNITYQWSPSASTEDLTGLAGGNYTLTITDGNNCSFTISTTVNEPALLTATTSHTNVTCFGANDGTVTITVAGGTAPYSYFGNPVPAGTTTFPNLAAGNYVGNLVDTNGCSASVSETITEPSALAVQSTVMDATAASATDGSITLNVSGGTANYVYVWSPNFSTSNSSVALSAGIYCFTVTDANNCTISGCDTVSAPTAIGNIANGKLALYPNPANNLITIETNSASGNFTFTVYTLEGKLVAQQIIIGARVSVDVKYLAQGLYSYQLKDVNSGDIKTGKLQIQR